MVSTALAVSPGFRCSAEMTHVPTLTREVAAATAPVIAMHSHHPWGLPGRMPQELIRSPDGVEPELLGSQRKITNVDPARRRTVDERVAHRKDETYF